RPLSGGVPAGAAARHPRHRVQRGHLAGTLFRPSGQGHFGGHGPDSRGWQETFQAHEGWRHRLCGLLACGLAPQRPGRGPGRRAAARRGPRVPPRLRSCWEAEGVQGHPGRHDARGAREPRPLRARLRAGSGGRGPRRGARRAASRRGERFRGGVPQHAADAPHPGCLARHMTSQMILERARDTGMGSNRRARRKVLRTAGGPGGKRPEWMDV
ncbi:unnamed protein product, partial [Prorocentrum cordatum]